MRPATLAPIPATLAISSFLVSGALAAEATETPAREAPPASAQTTTPAKAAPPAGQAKDASKDKAAEGTARLKDVNVTAREESEYKAESAQLKRAVPLKDTPQSVTIVTPQLLRERNATDLKQAVRNSPGITFNAGEGGNHGGDNFNMRGFNGQSDIFVDGVRDPSLYSRDTYATEQVEIAKGSSGVYQGRGSTGGSLNLVSRFARAGNSAEAGVLASSYASLRGELDVNREIPGLTPGTTAVRVVAMGQTGGSPRSGAIRDERLGVAPSVTVGLGEDTSVSLTHQHTELRRDPDYGIPFGTNAALGTTLAPAPVDYDNWYGIKGFDRDNTVADATTLVLQSAIDERNTLRNTTRYSTLTRDTIINRPGINGYNPATGQITLAPSARYVEDTFLTNQTDLLSKFKTGDIGHTLNVGAEVSHEETANRARVFTGAAPAMDLRNPNNDMAPTQTASFSGAKTVGTATTYGIYLNETLHLAKWIDLVGGLRLDRYEADTKSFPATGSATPYAFYDRTDTMLGWRGGVVLKPTDAVTLYGTVANSFNPSADNLALTAATRGAAPEESTLYEVGAKWEAVKDRLSLGLAAFIVDKNNLRQTVDPVLGTQDTIGRAVSQGVEFTVAGAITRRWNIFGGFALMDSEVKRTGNSAANLATQGKELTNTPDFSATLWNTFDVGDGWTAGIGVRYVGERWGDGANTARLDDYVVTDLMIAKQINDHCRIQLNVDNLTDERYIESARVAANSWATPGPGRTFTGSVRFSF